MRKSPIARLCLMSALSMLLPVWVGAVTSEPLTALPPVPVPDNNMQTPAKIELGKILYFDPGLSGDGTTSCASCHVPKLGWGDGNALSIGYPGTVHWRNSQTILNVAYLNKWFWTGSAATLEAQAKGALTGPLAQNTNMGLAEERMRQVPAYVKMFKDVFNSAPTFDNALLAIVAFECTIVSKNVPFDRHMKGEKNALGATAVKGLELFQGKAGCVQCHGGAMLTDQSFHNLGVPVNKIFANDPQRQIAMRERIKAKGIPEVEFLAFDRDPGHYLDTKKAEDKGTFRTPTLRELKYTGPYMHNGVFATLDTVIDFYDRGGDDDPFGTKSKMMKPLNLTKNEKAAPKIYCKTRGLRYCKHTARVHDRTGNRRAYAANARHGAELDPPRTTQAAPYAAAAR